VAGAPGGNLRTPWCDLRASAGTLAAGAAGGSVPAGAKDFEISDDLELPASVKVLSILPHAHYLCKEMRVFATLPDGTRKWLIWVKRWDFDWQGVFRYEEPVDLPKGTVLSMRYTYDNSSDNARNPNTPPRRVVGGQKSTEEMADAWLEVLPERREDLFALEIAMMRHKLAKYPHEPSGYADLGAALRAMGRNQEAIGPLREAAQRTTFKCKTILVRYWVRSAISTRRSATSAKP